MAVSGIGRLWRTVRLGKGVKAGADEVAAAAAGVSAEDVQDAITKAFQVAYDKSLEQQEEKMMPLYSDLGLSTS